MCTFPKGEGEILCCVNCAASVSMQKRSLPCAARTSKLITVDKQAAHMDASCLLPWPSTHFPRLKFISGPVPIRVAAFCCLPPVCSVVFHLLRRNIITGMGFSVIHWLVPACAVIKRTLEGVSELFCLLSSRARFPGAGGNQYSLLPVPQLASLESQKLPAV